MKKKKRRHLRPGDPALESFRVKNIPKDFGRKFADVIVNAYLAPFVIAQAEGTIAGLEFRIAELEDELRSARGKD